MDTNVPILPVLLFGFIKKCSSQRPLTFIWAKLAFLTL